MIKTKQVTVLLAVFCCITSLLTIAANTTITAVGPMQAPTATDQTSDATDNMQSPNVVGQIQPAATRKINEPSSATDQPSAATNQPSATTDQPSAAADKNQAGNVYEFDFRKGMPQDGRLSVEVPDGVYRVTVTVGSRKAAGVTTLRGESRRLFYENVATAKGEFKTLSFCIHKRNTEIAPGVPVKIKPREQSKLNWNNTLDLEFSGACPQVARVRIEPAPEVPVVFLCGNSTVVDQDNEPWASWGQMIPRFFTDELCFANFAESGESANTFIGARRLAKILSMIKPGDYVLAEFGHNDQKQTGEGKGAYLSFWDSMKTFVDSARAHGATPILVTPTQRRSFDETGHIKDTHKDFPQATRDLAAKEGTYLVDLHALTRTLYEAMGVEESKKAFVHYPAGSWPGQIKALADNTHFNPYGAYEVAKCVIEGLKAADVPFVKCLQPDYAGFDPACPDALDSFVWTPSTFVDMVKPDGN